MCANKNNVFYQNAYEESISEESSTDEEEDARQVKMAATAVALQLTARNSAGELISSYYALG